MTNKLISFLIEANAAGYASGDSKGIKSEKDGSKTITFESGNFRMHDNFFGGEPYAGREVVFYKNKPYWIMVYYGAVEKGTNPNDIYGFLQKSLKLMPKSAPFRGPAKHKKENLTYENKWIGNVEQFEGKEIIKASGKQVYWAKYMGGLVDRRK